MAALAKKQITPKLSLPAPTCEFVTPEMAYQWLGQLAKNQRSLRRSTVERYKRDMAAGKWGVNWQNGIAFDKEGNLIDGQHRLTALIEASKDGFPGVCMWVWRDQEIGYDAPVDQGLKRTTADLFHLERHEGTILQHLHALLRNRGRRQGGHNSPAELAPTIEAYRDLVDEIVLHGLPADVLKRDNPLSPCRVVLSAFAYAHDLDPQLVKDLARDTALTYAGADRCNPDNHVASQLGKFLHDWKANGKGWSPEIVTNVACWAICSALAIKAGNITPEELPRLDPEKTDGYVVLTELRRRAKVANTHNVIDVPSPERKQIRRWGF